MREVLQLQPRLNPGKFPLHDVILHGWIRLFGDGLTAMRTLSGLTGVLGIVAVFFVYCELLRTQGALQFDNSAPAQITSVSFVGAPPLDVCQSLE